MEKSVNITITRTDHGYQITGTSGEAALVSKSSNKSVACDCKNFWDRVGDGDTEYKCEHITIFLDACKNKLLSPSTPIGKEMIIIKEENPLEQSTLGQQQNTASTQPKTSRIHKAKKEKIKLRMAITGPSGSGKSYTSLSIASHLGGSICVIDTERGTNGEYGSSSLYADKFEFDTLVMESHDPREYTKAIKEVEEAGYEILIIDSLSHAWAGKDGARELAEKVAKQQAQRTGGKENTFTAWRTVTPIHNEMIDTILSFKGHVIVTMRSKQEYAMENDDKGRPKVTKLGFQPIQRDGVEYEHDIIGDMNQDNEMVIVKSRCPALTGKAFPKPGKEVAEILKAWLG